MKLSKFTKNFITAILAQLISFSASVLVQFIAPMLIGDVENFAYWQLFLFLVTYVNLSRLGLIDGLYLRLGGKNYKELDHSLLSTQWVVYSIFQTIVAVVLFGILFFTESNSDRLFVFGSCCVCIVLINSNNYFSYILQAVNETRKYSFSVILQNLCWFLAIALMLIFDIKTYHIIIIMYIVGHLLAGIYLMINAKEIVKAKKHNLPAVFQDIGKNIGCGIQLMISTYAGLLIIGSSKLLIEECIGLATFGYMSFSLTLANFFLNFISQVSLVLFPALKKVNPDKLETTYSFIRNLLSIILPFVLIGYLPICFMVKWLLPQYTPSLTTLVFFLPICVFDGKMQMLCSTYFKVLRKETLLLIINLCSLLISVASTLIGIYLINPDIQMQFIACGLLVVIAIRSIVSEIIISKMMHKNLFKDLIMEILLVVAFVLLTLFLKDWVSSLITVGLYVLYLVINKKKIKSTLANRKEIKFE